MTSDVTSPPQGGSAQRTARDVLVASVLLMAGGTLLAAGPGPGEADRTAPDGAAVADPLGREQAPPGSRALPGDGLAALGARVAVLPAYHRVEAGETLSSIAARYAIDPDDLARDNAIDDARALPVGERLVIPDPDAQRPTSVADAQAADLPVERVLEDVAAEFGWRPATVKAVAWVETRWTQRVVSSEGAIGVMQVRPATGERMARRVGRDLDLYDMRDNVTAGVAYLDYLYERFDGDMRAALAAYLQGPTSVRRDGAYPVSRRYVDDVLDVQEQLGD